MKWAFFIFVLIYALAILLFLIGTFGWYGQARDPLAGVFLMPIGLPWNIIADRLGISGLLAALLAPAVNAGILYWLWRR